jgi:starch synthase
VASRLDRFDNELAHRLYGGGDLLLMPSQYEPCGLTQMRAQRYGALPVVRRVGGLSDTVEDQVTGFVFDDYTTHALEVALRRAFATYRDRKAWERHMKEAMSRDFGWEQSARRYLLLYEDALIAHLYVPR